MTDEIKEGSVVKVNYVGSFLENGQVFDTSFAEIAKESNIFDDQRQYEPLKVTIGQKQVIAGFENALLGMKVGEEKIVQIPADDAYGQFNPELVGEVPDDQFTENNIQPESGMLIQTNQGIATIDSYNSETGIVTLNFNHPFAGKDLQFKLEVVEIN